jgi:hypothetical protein
MKINVVLTCALGLALAACESNTSPSESANPAKENALIGKRWMPVTDVFHPGIQISGELITDNMMLRQECDHDGTTQFASDGTYTSDEGPTKCSEDAPQTVTGKWSLNTERTQITMTENGGDVQIFDIETLNDTALKISREAAYWDESVEHRQIFGFSAK